MTEIIKKQKYKKLKVWHKAMDYIDEASKVTRVFPKSEDYVLTQQLRRASISIALNIAEGSAAQSEAVFKRFLNIALRSAYETMCAIHIAQRLEYCDGQISGPLIERCDELSAMISGLCKRLNKADSRKLIADS